MPTLPEEPVSAALSTVAVRSVVSCSDIQHGGSASSTSRGGVRAHEAADSQRLVEAGDAAVAVGNLMMAESEYKASIRAASCSVWRATGWQRLSGLMLARAAEGGGGGVKLWNGQLLREALEAADASLAERPGEPLALFCWASAAMRLEGPGLGPQAAGERLKQIVHMPLPELDTQTSSNTSSDEALAMELWVRAELVRCHLAIATSEGMKASTSRLAAAEDSAAIAEARAVRRALVDLLRTSRSAARSEEDNSAVVPPTTPSNASLGSLDLEMELLACAAEVRGLGRNVCSPRLASSATPVDRVDVCKTFDDVALMDLHEVVQWGRASTREGPPPLALAADLMLPEVAADVGHVANCLSKAAAPLQSNLEEVVRRLSWVARLADEQDHYDILWQALAWRCRAHVFAQEWCGAASDATKAMLLNVFGAAELRDWPCQEPEASQRYAGEERLPWQPEAVVQTLASPWACLRMRALALKMLGNIEGARADAALLLHLLQPPPDSAGRPGVCAASGAESPWSNPRRSVDTTWTRTPAQLASFRRQRQFLRDGVFSMPQSF